MKTLLTLLILYLIAGLVISVYSFIGCWRDGTYQDKNDILWGIIATILLIPFAPIMFIRGWLYE